MTTRLPLSLRVLAWRARPLLLVLAVVAACGAAARVAAPPAPATATVVVAATDLSAGHVLTDADLRRVALPARLRPDAATADAAGLRGAQLLTDVPRGLPLVEAHLVRSRFGRTPPAGTVAVPVQLADAAVTALLRPGDRVDLVAASPDPWSVDAAPAVLAESALVLEVRRTDDPDAGSLGLLPTADLAADLVVVAVPPGAGHRIAGAAQGSLGAVLVAGS